MKLINHDEAFHGLKREVLIINDLSDVSETDLITLRRKISVTYDSELMSSIPSCECGALMGEWKIGEKCNQCYTECSPPIEPDFESILWLRAPIGTNGPLLLMNPTVWLMLSNRFTKSGWNILKWLTDTRYESQSKPIKETEKLLDMGVQRGWSWFCNNFDQLMDVLFNLPGLKRKPSHAGYKESNDLQKLLLDKRDCVFSNYLPLPNRSLLVIEKTNVEPYSNNENIGAIDAIQSMIGIDSELSGLSQKDKENRVARGIAGIAEYYYDFYTASIEPKPGIARKHLLGCRSHLSFRNVITSIKGPHDHDELHMPWGVATTVLEYHVYNKLFKQNWTVNEMLGLMNKYAHEYSPFIDNIFEQLIAESPFKGLPVTHGRNPSLHRGSLQLLFATKVKKDPKDPTTSFSDLISSPYNSDFDGDAMSSTLVPDVFMAQGLMDLRPFFSGLDLKKPRQLSKHIIQTKPVVGMMANYYHHRDFEPLTEQQAAFMQALAR